MSAGRYFAVIDPETDRGRNWVRLFGRDWIEVESPETHLAECDLGVRPFYKVRLTALSPEELGRLYVLLAEIWEGTIEEVVAEVLGDYGVPILAEGVAICADVEEGRARFARDGGRSS